MKTEHALKLVIVLFIMTAPRMYASIDGTPHDLSAVGGGNACSFCHTPHGAMSNTPLWNHQMSRAVYNIYQSRSLNAKVGQPTGVSKLCLSCHDGTVALNSTLHNPYGSRYIGDGGSALGTDLSNDHPISFVYSHSLAAVDYQIRPPDTLPEQLKLDKNGELQCTTCHDPHDNKFGNMLVMSNVRSQMCTGCHALDAWESSLHRTSTASVVGSSDSYLTSTGYATVSENGCLSCHRPHSAGGNEQLMHFQQMEDNCLSCHDGTVAKTDIASALNRPSRHGVQNYEGIHDTHEKSSSLQRHVECVDCHNPHAVRDIAAQPPVASGVMSKASGVTLAGADIQAQRYEYEICFKCHSDNPDRVQSTITRQITQTNTRLEFGTSTVSRHPVAAPGANKNVPSLKSPLTVNSRIYCTHCHNADSSSVVKGPHGSRHRPLLAYNYSTRDFTNESEYAYQLCYQCHSRNSILGNQSFPKHKEHLDQDVPCSACHDAHGINSSQGTAANNSHLINFDINIVDTDPDTGLRRFVDKGTYHGECNLLCHSTKHSPARY